MVRADNILSPKAGVCFRLRACLYLDAEFT